MMTALQKARSAAQKVQSASRLATAFLALIAVFPPAGPACADSPPALHVERRAVADLKAVFATVESVRQLAARARLGGTLGDLTVREGDRVTAGQVLGVVRDTKLPLQQAALDARSRALEAQERQARQELERARQLRQTGSGSQQRLDDATTALEVLGAQAAAVAAERAVLAEQMREGEIHAPAAGRVLKVLAVDGTVIMPGEPVAMVATETYVLRLRLPERHARFLKVGDAVKVGERGLGGEGALRAGTITLVYPELVQGRVVADAEASGLGDFFVGERVQVHVSTGQRETLVVPQAAVFRRFGLDYVRRTQGGDTVVQVGPSVDGGAGVEILSGLVAGEGLVQP